MTYIYRSRPSVQAITFDLDDTLYDNTAVIKQAEQAFWAHLQQRYTVLARVDQVALQQAKTYVYEQRPDIYHDVTAWRRAALQHLLQQQGLSVVDSEKATDEAMLCFFHWRNKITVTDETHQVLQALASRFPLGVITNGNAQPAQFGLADYFQFILHAGIDGRAKPYADMYQRAARQFAIPLSALLHVGDELATDIVGARQCGAQSCWINTSPAHWKLPDEKEAPDMRISRLASLLSLL